MSTCRRLLVLGVLLGVLSALTGCQGPGHALDCPEPVCAGAPPAENAQTQTPDGKMLLRTGAIQLGPGVGKNLWRWQGDGEGGF